MSVPPSSLYPNTGISYNALDTCLYSVLGQIGATPTPVDTVLPFDADTGANPSNLFVNFGRNVGLKPNRAVPADGTEPLVGALVNTNSQPVYLSGVLSVYVNGGAFDIGEFLLKHHKAGQDITTATPIGTLYSGASEPILNMPFSVVLKSGDSIFLKNIVQQTNPVGVILNNVRASVVYGNEDNIQAGYIA